MKKFPQIFALIVTGVFLCSAQTLAAPAGANESLQFESGKGNVAKVQQLLAQGADPNAMGTPFKPLENAIFSGNLAMVKVLLDAGARPNDGTSYHPVVLAVNYGNYAVLETLLRMGGNANAYDARLGGTAKALATQKGRSDMVTLLTSFGAN